MTSSSQQRSVKNLLELLDEDLKTCNLKTSEREDILTKLKVLGRDVNNLGPPYFDHGIKVLGAYAFGDYTRTISREALRCIANALLLMPNLRKTFVGQGFDQKAARAFANLNDDDEFLLSRILFLLTYEPDADFETLINNFQLVDNITAHIAHHAKQTSSGKALSSEPPMTVMALSETLKLLFNVTNAKPQQISRFLSTVPDLLSLLVASPISEPPLQPPSNYILNVLAALDFDTIAERQNSSSISVSHETSKAEIEKTITLLDKAITSYSPSQLETQAIPLLTVLRKMNQGVPEDIREYMKNRLLPDDSERDLPLGKSSSLASRLLNLTTSPGLINLPEAISSLLYEISDSDASKYVKNVGYGYAAGYLMSHRIPIPESLQPRQKEETNMNHIPINPVTGQRLDKEPEISGLPMTREEKEREAERLYVLFERLRATGVVDVKNPVHQAMEDGRFEEISDSDSD